MANAVKHQARDPTHILVVVAEMGHGSQREIVGITRFAKRNGLSVDIVHDRHFGDGPDFAQWIEFWKPGGLIVDPAYAFEALADKAASSLPMVIWDASMASGFPERCARVMSDPNSIAEAAARELFRAEFQQFAFVPAMGDPAWSRERGAVFGRLTTGSGRTFASFSPKAAESRAPVSFQTRLVDFLRSLPKPCGIFAANDATAALVVKAASALGLRFPDDLTLVGVDDSDEYCERSDPTISSVRCDVEAGGEEAARLLAELMARGKRSTGRKYSPPVATYGAKRLVRRSSSRLFRDRRVDRAMECIRLNACEEGFGPRMVVRQMGVSSTIAYPLFHAAAGRTILDEIHAVRLAHAMELLANGVFPDLVASECGYASHADFRRVFRQRIGATVRQWTLAHRR